MLSKNKIKFIQSLHRKRNRDELGLFIAEGEKLVNQLIDSGYQIQTIITSPSKIHRFSELKTELFSTSNNNIKKISTLKTPQDVIAICYQKNSNLSNINLSNELIIALDDIQDPGNLGTIIRMASWFGIRNIVCSKHTVDCYNPKVIQSTMGAIAQVTVHYTSLTNFLNSAIKQGSTTYGTFLDGENIYTASLNTSGILIMGNEGQGISTAIEKLIDQKLFIPSFTANQSPVESLNVSVATSIACSEFRRRTI